MDDELRNGACVYRDRTPKSRGWRVVTSLLGERRQVYFADSRYGSASAARAAAQAHAQADEAVRRELLALTRALQVRRSSRSGLPGVARYEGEAERGPYWRAYWTDPRTGKKVNRRFSVAKLGEDEAWRSALLARSEAVAWAQARHAELVSWVKARAAGADVGSAGGESGEAAIAAGSRESDALISGRACPVRDEPAGRQAPAGSSDVP